MLHSLQSLKKKQHVEQVDRHIKEQSTRLGAGLLGSLVISVVASETALAYAR